MMNHVDDAVVRLLKEMESLTDHVDAWTAARRVLRSANPAVVQELAVRFLIAAFFDEPCSFDVTEPSRRQQKRRRPEVKEKLDRRSAGLEAHERRMEEINARMWAGLRRATDIFASELKEQWTAELLDSSFTLPDGTQVKWGDATLAQHEAGVELNQARAAKHLSVAARHQQAAQVLRDMGVVNLRSVLTDAAA